MKYEINIFKYRLNEGFASFVEYLGLNNTHPEWKDVSFFRLNNN